MGVTASSSPAQQNVSVGVVNRRRLLFLLSLSLSSPAVPTFSIATQLVDHPEATPTAGANLSGWP